MSWKTFAPKILAVGAVGGIFATGVLTGRATIKAAKLVDANDGIDVVIRKTWKLYIPPAAAALFSASCVIGAHILNMNQQASLLAGQMAVSKSFGKFKRKLSDMYGEEIPKNVDKAILTEECEDVNLVAYSIGGGCELVVPEDAKPMIFRESVKGRCFVSTLSKVIDAEYNVNRNFVLGGQIPYSELIEFLGLKPTEEDEAIGWSIDDEFYWIDFDHRVKEENGRKICEIVPMFSPTKEYLDEGVCACVV